MEVFSLGAVLSIAALTAVSSGVARLRRRNSQKAATGLQTLADNEEAEVDFVCVHRLGANSTEAWTTRSGTKRINWLKTLLPQDVPKARVLTYGYNSDLERSKYFQDVLYLQSSALLAQLASKRPDSLQQRPIIFIAHGVGGLIVKTALIESSAAVVERDIGLKAIQLSTVGVLYFGTPHQSTQWDKMITRVVSLSLVPSNTSPESLVQVLAAQRDSLGLLFDRYKSIEADVKNYTFSEGLPTEKGQVGEPGKSESLFVVPKQTEVFPSAGKWWIHQELMRSHEDLVKFGDREDADYQEVIKSIKSCLRDFEKAKQRHDKFRKDLDSLYVEPPPKVKKRGKPRSQQLKPIVEPLSTAPSPVEKPIHTETERKYKDDLVKYEELYGLSDPRTLDVLDNFAQVYVDKADYKCAEMIYKRIFVAKQNSDGPSSLSVARVLTQIAAVAQQQGQHSEAESCLHRAIEIKKIILGPDDSETIQTSARLAELYNLEGRLEDAKRVYDDCMDKIEGAKNARRRSDDMTLDVLIGSAENLRDLGKNDEAAATYTTIIERRRSRSDSDADPLLASTVVKLADTYEDMGKVNDMRKVLDRGPLPRLVTGVVR